MGLDNSKKWILKKKILRTSGVITGKKMIILSIQDLGQVLVGSRSVWPRRRISLFHPCCRLEWDLRRHYRRSRNILVIFKRTLSSFPLSGAHSKYRTKSVRFSFELAFRFLQQRVSLSLEDRRANQTKLASDRKRQLGRRVHFFALLAVKQFLNLWNKGETK